MIGKLLFEMNILSKGHLVEAERADLVGEYIGHTAQNKRFNKKQWEEFCLLMRRIH